MGTFQATLTYKEHQISETVFVLKDQLYSLLSKKACVDLGLIARIGEVNTQPVNFIGEFPQLFLGLGKLETKYHIKLNPDVKPVCLYTPRKIPHPLFPKVKNKIDSVLPQGIISPVTVPTEWCSGNVPVPKPNGRVRICVDLTPLNKAVQRETHPMGSVDESLAMLGESRVFTKLVANSGFWQIPLDEDTKLLTTFVTPLAAFASTACPLELVLPLKYFSEPCLTSWRALMESYAGWTTSLSMEVKFLGHIVDAQDVHADPEKTRTIGHFPTATTVTELQSFMGMVNQLGKFVPGLADITAPLQHLLRKDSA